jgi:hypothetical protein
VSSTNSGVTAQQFNCKLKIPQVGNEFNSPKLQAILVQGCMMLWLGTTWEPWALQLASSVRADRTIQHESKKRSKFKVPTTVSNQCVSSSL